MSDHHYKKIEIVGTSTKSIDEAVQNAIRLAGKSVRNMRWFEVMETRGNIDNDRIAHWQVTVKIGFKIEEET
jgi:flavin-binding protein dodecin